MKRIRLSSVLVLVLALGAGGLLMSVSQHVQKSENEIAALKADIAKEKNALRILAAEWSYLNRPDRVQGLVENYLDMDMPQPAQIMPSAGGVDVRKYPAVPSRKPASLAVPVSTSHPVVQPNDRSSEIPASLPPSRPYVKPSLSPHSSDKSFQSLMNNLVPESKSGAE